MVKKAPRGTFPVLAGALVFVAAWLWVRSAMAPAVGAQAGEAAVPTAGRAEGEVPRIGLDRLQQARAERRLGRRDLFDFATPPPPPPTPVPPPTPLPQMEAPMVTAPTPPPLPALNIKYIGTVERRGLKLAMFMTDRKEVLTGQQGQVVANRFVVKRIGLESADIQELGSEQVRRIPLKGN
jgi:hypothetical protein